MSEIEAGVILAFILVSVFLISLLSDFLFGKKDGPFESYYRSGQLKEKGTYRDGELEGLCEEYYENGQLEWRGTYNMGEECGEWFEDGETVTYSPCPPDLDDGN